MTTFEGFTNSRPMTFDTASTGLLDAYRRCVEYHAKAGQRAEAACCENVRFWIREVRRAVNVSPSAAVGAEKITGQTMSRPEVSGANYPAAADSDALSTQDFSSVAAEFAVEIIDTIALHTDETISDYGHRRLEHSLREWLWLLSRDDRAIIAEYVREIDAGCPRIHGEGMPATE